MTFRDVAYFPDSGHMSLTFREVGSNRGSGDRPFGRLSHSVVT
jgi:hypothetical protein